jgi:DinB superfamily
MTARNKTTEAWAIRLMSIPSDFAALLGGISDQQLRHRPGTGEWSAIEVVGHMVDKMTMWRGRVEQIRVEDTPQLPGYDQDAFVREHDYQHAELLTLLEGLDQVCPRFSAAVLALTETDLGRIGIHGELGRLTIADCIRLPLEAAELHRAQMIAALRS